MSRQRIRIIRQAAVTWCVVLAIVAVTGAAESAKDRLLKTAAAEHYVFTPKVREAFLAHAKAQARADLKEQGKSLPAEFLAWVDADADVEACVYGTHAKPSDVLLHLYSLRLDLGKAKFEKYRQLALAMAVVEAKKEAVANILPRKPVKLVIGGDPRKPVNTNDPGRELDRNDHIINFLNDNTIEEEVVVGHKEVLPELKYDDRGIAIPAPKKKGKPKKVPITEKRTRSLRGADVIASQALQEKFNAYMKAKGHDVQIDCGERVVHWKSRDMVRGEPYKKINEAYLLFRGAYEAKGLLPAERDPKPTSGERCAYLIRNDEYKFPAELQAKRKWPRYPLTAPWPTLIMLVADRQPLRECEERWIAFRDKGEFRTYGEYIGSIAQQGAMQSARRVAPHDFTYGSIQMMLKDGGVCGTMAAISSRSHNTLGVPAVQASQPGHCALVTFRYDPKSDTYACKGGQYATGGDEKTGPFSIWVFGDNVKQYRKKKGVSVPYYIRKPMVYHQSVAWAVNHGMRNFHDSLMAYGVFRLLPEATRQTKGMTLLESGLAVNPYCFLLVDTAQAAADTPQRQIGFWKTFLTTLAAAGGKPGCPTEGLYPKTVRKRLFARIAALPVPEDKKAAREVLAFLEAEKCDIPAALVAYRVAIEGLPALLARTEKEFTDHLQIVGARASRENDTACAAMTATIKAVSARVKDRKQRKAWAGKLREAGQGHEKYFGNKYRLATNPAVSYLARLAGRKMPPDAELVQPVLERLAAELKASVAGDRNVKACRLLAAKVKGAAGGVKDPDQKRQWLEGLAKVIAGKETFKPAKAKRNAKPLRDPCADTIKQVLLPLQEEAKDSK